MPSRMSSTPGARASAIVLLGLAATAARPGMADDPPPPRDVTAESDIPRGAGIAAKFPADRGIAAHPAVIFAEDFEEEGFRERWDEVRDRDGEVLRLADESGSGAPVGRKSLEVKATLGRNTGGGLTRWFEPPPTLYIRFYAKFDAGCDYVHHFVTLRANRGLRGGDRWSGFGGAGELPEGDGRFSTALEPWGNWGRWPPPGRWNFYSYWHEMRKSGDGKYWGNGFRPETQEDIPRGRWISCELMLRHNTPGERDGEQAFWIDGELRGHWKGFSWRTSESLWANALTLEAYVTDRWTKNRFNTVYFDDVVIAREYIGPTAPPAKD